jgi:hypothetical protein
MEFYQRYANLNREDEKAMEAARDELMSLEAK